MSEENIEEKLEEVKDIPIEPLEVKITNPTKPEPTMFDDVDDSEYENMYPTDEQIKEYEEEEK